MTTDTTQKPLNAIAHELLTGKPCVYTTVGEHLRLGGFFDWYTEDLTGRVPQYDTDIAAAWRLVEAMRAGGAWVEMVGIGTGDCTCQITYLGQGIIKRHAANRCKTMPLAITTAFIEACEPEASE